ncbi:DedA family protein [Clostridiaceae bacterium UIB06]|uniref:DedA family protein n=1 Tax=Clostridium thailandense TaxID=2794346 RepID=A0A949TG99_9CLOT|nr:DedA family protein [Clostridium thailandense]MBV7271665.1 DedA family protein [Clostridium thailandense]MCH5136364.1 DedA family protein [Clostridiaceae bacterium UIB06]
MSIVGAFINVILHLDKYLNIVVQDYGIWTYVLIFIIIFCETGLVVTPFLPGDSILFATGALASIGVLKIIPLFMIFYLAAVIGDTVNYHIGQKIGNKILDKEDVKYINKEYLKKAHSFYEKHGSMTIVVGRFIPIIRTFVPFVAGIGEMSYSKFITYNILGGFMWVVLFLWGGYFFGDLPFIKQHFSYVLIAIIIISIIPGIVTFIKEKRNGGNKVNDVINT